MSKALVFARQKKGFGNYLLAFILSVIFEVVYFLMVLGGAIALLLALAFGGNIFIILMVETAIVIVITFILYQFIGNSALISLLHIPFLVVVSVFPWFIVAVFVGMVRKS